MPNLSPASPPYLGIALAWAIAGAGPSACAPSPSEHEPRTETVRQGLVTSLAFELPSSLSSRSVAVAATRALSVEDGAEVLDETGLVPAAVANIGSGETNLGMDARTGPLFSVGNVVLRGRNDPSTFNVSGDVKTGGTIFLQNNAGISGAQQQGVAIPTHASTLETSVPFVAGADDNLQNERNATYVAGNFGRVHVFSRSALTLGPGDYYFESLSIEPEARVVLHNAERPVRIFVRDRFYFHGTFEEQATGALAANLLVYYLGTQDTNLFTPFVGTIYAPNAHLILDTLQQGKVHRGAFFGKSVTVRPRARILHKPFQSNLIGKVTLSKTEVCANEEARVEVEPPPGMTGVSFTIDGMATDHRYVQFRDAVAGPRRISVLARKGTQLEHRTVTVNLVACPAAEKERPFVVVAPDREGKYVDFRVLNAGELSGQDKRFVWEFGDGRTEETDHPYAAHSYTKSLNTTDLMQVFDAKLTVKRSGLPDLVTHETVVHYNHYAHMRARGLIPVDVMGSAEPGGSPTEMAFEFDVFNREASPLAFDTVRLERHFCDPELDPEPIETRTVAVSVAPGAERRLSASVAASEIDATVCGVAVQFTGAHSGMPAFAKEYFEVGRSSSDARPITDSTARAKVGALRGMGLMRADGTIRGEDVHRALKEGRITRSDLPAPPSGPTLAASTTGSSSGSLGGIRVAGVGGAPNPSATGTQVGEACDPSDEPPPGFECMPDEDAAPIYSGAYVRNALKGDLLLNQKCSLIGGLFQQTTPPINYSHEAIMTRNYISLAHTTREQDLMMDGGRVLFGWGAKYLRYGFPGAIRENVEQAFTEHEIHWPDKNEDVTLHGFDPVATACTWDQVVKPMLVVKPVPGDDGEHEARAKLREVADFARDGGASDTHYRFYSFSEGAISFLPSFDDDCDGAPQQCESGNDRERAAASATYLWWMLKRHGVVLEGTELEPFERNREYPVQAADRGTGQPPRTFGLNPTEQKDGLYYYTAAEREAAALWLWNKVYNTVLDGLSESTLGSLIGSYTPLELERVANARGLQLAACFTKDECHELAPPGVELVVPPEGRSVTDTALNSALLAAVYSPGDGHTVSPDEFLNWDRPSDGGAYGYSERMAYGDFRVVFPHHFVPVAERAATICVRDENDGLPVQNLRLLYKGIEHTTDQEGCVSVPNLSVGEQRLAYTCNGARGLPDGADGSPGTDPSLPSCSHATCMQSLDGDIVLQVASVTESPDDPLPSLERCGDAHCVSVDLSVDESKRVIIARGLAFTRKDSGLIFDDAIGDVKTVHLECHLPSTGGSIGGIPGFPDSGITWGPEQDRSLDSLGCSSDRVTHRASMECELLPNNDIEVTISAITYRDRDVFPSCELSNRESVRKTFIVRPNERAGARMLVAKSSANISNLDGDPRDQTGLWFGVDPPTSWNSADCWGSDPRCEHPPLSTRSNGDGPSEVGGHCSSELFGIWNLPEY